MHDIMRKRLWRKLEALPEEQLYQVLDFIEFLEAKYAPGVAAEPGSLQRFAERVEDRMRARAISPRIMGGAMTLLGAASRVIDGIAQTGKELFGGGATGSAGRAEAAGGSRPAGRGPTPAVPSE